MTTLCRRTTLRGKDRKKLSTRSLYSAFVCSHILSQRLVVLTADTESAELYAQQFELCIRPNKRESSKLAITAVATGVRSFQAVGATHQLD